MFQITVKISLNDCLACSGCITSAETILVEEQSLTRFLDGIVGKQLCVVTVSPQSVCSIAVKRGLSTSQAARLIASYFFSREEAYQEFLSRSIRPILVSSCPGFVCYAEKSHDAFLLPYISNVRSPQAIHGALVKDFLSRRLEIPATSIYHASVMPCFDKKLEAARLDFCVPGTEVRETDCVISTVEVDSVLDDVETTGNVEEKGWLGDFPRGVLYGNEGGTSGGFATSIVRRFVSEHGGEITEEKVDRNLDVISARRDGNTILRVARIYGFRNIQNFVRKMKNNKPTYDYIEIMACPNGSFYPLSKSSSGPMGVWEVLHLGCANGGAQIRADIVEKRDHILRNVENAYSTIQNDAAEEMRYSSLYIDIFFLFSFCE
uniref:Fe_hyd_lg_C domain-containing protein n=1 Tax=Angiostrongylus cantonensis TaxID=6313 RepID=A0A158P9A9_ANGCA